MLYQANRPPDLSDKIEQFDATVHEFRNQLKITVRELDQHYYQLVEATRIRLESLFDSSDYPSSLEDGFEVTWDFPSVEPPSYLQELNSALYQKSNRNRFQIQANADFSNQSIYQPYIGSGCCTVTITAKG